MTANEIQEQIIARAGLSPRESEVYQRVRQDISNDRIAVELKMTYGTVGNTKFRAMAKIRKAEEAVYQEYREAQERELRAREGEDAASLEGRRSTILFVLDVMRGPAPSSPPTPVFGRTYTDSSGITLSERVRPNIGGRLVTPDDLMGRNEVASAWEARVKPPERD